MRNACIKCVKHVENFDTFLGTMGILFQMLTLGIIKMHTIH